MKAFFISLIVFATITNETQAQTKVAIFGGSVAQYFNDKGVQKELESSMPGYTFTNFAKAGDGLCRQTIYENGSVKLGGIPLKVKEVCGSSEYFDVYVIWCSTNDIWGCPIGQSNDYTNEDGFNEQKLLTQCGGLNYVIKTIQSHSPNARILIFASLKYFGSSYGYSKTGETQYNAPRRMWNYVEKQIDCANRFSLPILNLWTDSGINEYNYKTLCPDGIHPSKEAYRLLCPMFKSFISYYTSTGKMKR